MKIKFHCSKGGEMNITNWYFFMAMMNCLSNGCQVFFLIGTRIFIDMCNFESGLFQMGHFITDHSQVQPHYSFFIWKASFVFLFQLFFIFFSFEHLYFVFLEWELFHNRIVTLASTFRLSKLVFLRYGIVSSSAFLLVTWMIWSCGDGTYLALCFYL